METAIGVFDSLDRAAEALKNLLRQNVPQESIVFLTLLENDAVTVARELAAYSGGLMRNADVSTTVLNMRGLGPVLAVTIGTTALGGLTSAANSPVTREKASGSPGEREALPNDEPAALFKLLQGRQSVVLVRTPWHEIATVACKILGCFGTGTQERTSGKLRITTRHVNAIAVLDLNGKIQMGEGAVMLRETLQDLMEKGHKRILLNLKEVQSVDSSGIGEFVRIHTTLRKQGGQLKLTNLYRTLDDILHMTCLHTVLDLQPDEATALKSFGRIASANA